MANAQDASLEEILWRSPPHVQMMGGFLHSNNILFYFAESPFFDATSNNASLAIQASYNEAFRHFVETREAFEGRLKTMQGLEFVVAYDPLQAAAQSETSFAHEPSNVWVIRKQTRRKQAGMEDEVVVLSTYFVVGDCVYMAPSVGSVVGNRILSAVTSLTKMLKTASSMPIFTPSYGHTYVPPVPRVTDTTTTTRTQSGIQAQQLSKENTPVPDTENKPEAPLDETSAVQDTRNFAEAFSLLSRYGEEYMDETPLVGEPGSFIMSKSGDASTSHTALAARPSGAAAGSVSNAPPTRTGTPSIKGEPSTSLPGKATGKPGTPVSERGKLKRKKSKA